jgi:hypothetical protein
MFLTLSFALLATFSLGACIEADVDDGILLCSTDPHRLCPRHYYCADNDYCYHDGHPAPPPQKPVPDMASANSGSE